MKKQPIIEGFVLLNVSTKKFVTRFPGPHQFRGRFTNKLQEAKLFHSERSAKRWRIDGELVIPLARFFHSGGK